jgi:hypothetical protein
LKAIQIIGFSLVWVLVFLIAGAATGLIRAGHLFAIERSSVAYSDASLLEQYSFLQYNQAGREKAKAALLTYRDVLQKIRSEKIAYAPNTLHFDYGLTCLRLYRLEVAANQPSEADTYLRSAQKEFSSLGWKDVSSDFLAKTIDTREAAEARAYDNDEAPPLASKSRRP